MKIKFLPMDKEVEIEPNQTVLQVAWKNDIHIKSVCKGVPNCAECRVRVVDGEHNVIPPSSKELSLIGTAYFVDQRRLSCQLRCFGDVVIDLSEQVENLKKVQERKGAEILEHGPDTAKEAKKVSRYDNDIQQAEAALYEQETKEALSRIKSKKTKKGEGVDEEEV